VALALPTAVHGGGGSSAAHALADVGVSVPGGRGASGGRRAEGEGLDRRARPLVASGVRCEWRVEGSDQ